MSELAQIQKALEESQSKLQGLFDEQKKQIEQNGTISKQLQDDMAKVNEDDQNRSPSLRSRTAAFFRS
jgi:peptidoglycan hydrolase CwlO-like protein